jgi:hypothetical protein
MEQRELKTQMTCMIRVKKAKKESRGILQLKTRINLQLRNKKRMLMTKFLMI